MIEIKWDVNLINAAQDLLDALIELEREAELSLDFRPEFRRAIANAHVAIAKARRKEANYA